MNIYQRPLHRSPLNNLFASLRYFHLLLTSGLARGCACVRSDTITMEVEQAPEDEQQQPQQQEEQAGPLHITTLQVRRELHSSQRRTD